MYNVIIGTVYMYMHVNYNLFMYYNTFCHTIVTPQITTERLLIEAALIYGCNCTAII